MKIAILGAGSLGCAIGGVLAEHGNEVVLVNHHEDFCSAINLRGLTLNEGGLAGVSRTVRVQAVSAIDARLVETKPFDLLVVLVKSKDTQAVVRAALPWVSKQTTVMSLQNGLGHEDLISQIVGSEHVLAGKTYCGGQITAPGVVTLGIRGKETLIGELGGQMTDRVREIAQVFNQAALKTTPTSKIQGAMWDKVLVNIATGAITGITGLVYGLLYQAAELEEIGCAAVMEAMEVARALKIAISVKNPRDAWIRAGAGLPFEFKTSMLQTLEKKMVTEIDYINGVVVREGKRLGIATPVNATLLACIKGIEFGWVKSGFDVHSYQSRLNACH